MNHLDEFSISTGSILKYQMCFWSIFWSEISFFSCQCIVNKLLHWCICKLMFYTFANVFLPTFKLNLGKKFWIHHWIQGNFLYLVDYLKFKICPILQKNEFLTTLHLFTDSVCIQLVPFYYLLSSNQGTHQNIYQPNMPIPLYA